MFAALSPGGLRFGGDGQEGATLKRQVAAFEREVILHTIEREGSLRRAARALGVITPPWSKSADSTKWRRRAQIIGEFYHHPGDFFHHLLLPLFPVHPVHI